MSDRESIETEMYKSQNAVGGGFKRKVYDKNIEEKSEILLEVEGKQFDD